MKIGEMETRIVSVLVEGGSEMRTAINGIPKERISITLDAELLEKVRIQAERDDRSLSQYINRVLKKAVREQSEES